jgi:hypothetical protein
MGCEHRSLARACQPFEVAANRRPEAVEHGIAHVAMRSGRWTDEFKKALNGTTAGKQQQQEKAQEAR